MKKVQIGKRLVGEGEPCFVIAEAGSNHNGKLEQAKKLIDVAAQARADAVKFQLFRADRLYTRNAGESNYLKLGRPIYEIIADMEMPYEWLSILAEYCQDRGIVFMASAFDEKSADRLDPYVQVHKIASYEMTHTPLVRHIARKGKPMLLSTGTADISEVTKTVDSIKSAGNESFILLQCTAAYPAPIESLNIRAMQTLSARFGVPAGLSDHSRDPLIGPLAAVSLDAAVIEKHFTTDNDLPGPDHKFALEPEELILMVRKIRETQQALGSGEKTPHPVEQELRSFARRSIFSVQPLAPGDVVTLEKVAVLRCGKQAAGLEPDRLDEILGRKVLRAVPAETAIREGDVA